jgi:hypothetical protein
MQLADSEQVITEVPLGAAALSGTMALTNRRLVMISPSAEESIPLAQVANIRSAFLRDYSAAVVGAVILVLALGFGAGYKSLETALNGGIYSAQKHFFEKTAESDGNNYGRYINISGGLIWLLMLPLLGWGGYMAYKGVVGETELVVGTAAGEWRRLRDGNRRDFREFVEEAGRRLP